MVKQQKKEENGSLAFDGTSKKKRKFNDIECNTVKVKNTAMKKFEQIRPTEENQKEVPVNSAKKKKKKTTKKTVQVEDISKENEQNDDSGDDEMFPDESDVDDES
jgi:hypothetical protein